MSVTQESKIKMNLSTMSMPQLQQNGMDETVAVRLTCSRDGLDHLSLLIVLAVWLKLWLKLRTPLGLLRSDLR